GLRYCRVLSPAHAVRDGLPCQPLPGGAVSVGDYRFAVQWTIRRHPWSAGVGLSHSSRHLLECCAGPSTHSLGVVPARTTDQSSRPEVPAAWHAATAG